jgi:hypothetical protein
MVGVTQVAALATRIAVTALFKVVNVAILNGYGFWAFKVAILWQT